MALWNHFDEILRGWLFCSIDPAGDQNRLSRRQLLVDDHDVKKKNWT